ncbi:MAG: hypothetical protein ABI035_07280 [Gemmatimonadaceae bacterium]
MIGYSLRDLAFVVVTSLAITSDVAIARSDATRLGTFHLTPRNSARITMQSTSCPTSDSTHTHKCVAIECDSRLLAFVGTWKGEFQAYAQELSKNGKSVFRPYENSVTYSKSDCMSEVDSHDEFIVGHFDDVYPAFEGLPAKTENQLLIMGFHTDGSSMMTMVTSTKQVYPYRLVYRNKAASFAVWEFTVPAHGGSPEMDFTTIDGKDFTEQASDRRNVTVTLRVGPAAQPYFQGVVTYGFHTLQKS